jgi:mono/diheme cytochrome c family protein
MKKHTIVTLAFVLSFMIVMAVGISSVGASNRHQQETLEQGRYIATIAGCTECHTPLKPEYQDPTTLTLDQLKVLSFNGVAANDESRLLAGGRAFDLGPAGILFTRNITPDAETGIGAWTDEQVKIAIKSGLNTQGEVLFPVMPYHVYNGMADADLDAVVAYLRSVNAVRNEVPARTIPTDGFPSLPYTTGIVAPDASDKAARGGYLVNSIMGCTDCHTPVDPATGAPVMEKYLAGRQPYEGPWGIVYGGNITPDNETGIGTWTEEEITRAITSGVSRDGRRLILMPWYAYSAITSEDAEAVAFYLKNVLPAVKNQIPAASLNEGFQEIVPQSEFQGSAGSGALSPVILVVVGVGIILLVSVAVALLRRRSA